MQANHGTANGFGVWAGGVLLGLAFLMSGCYNTFPSVRPDKRAVVLEQPEVEIAEAALLDVRIAVFDPGKLPESKNASRGLSTEIRDVEARYIPIQLKQTLQESRYWGAIRVVPDGRSGDEVLVSGEILKSNGEELSVQVRAVDARGQEWFDEKFKSAVSEEQCRAALDNGTEVFPNAFNSIANTLAGHYRELSQEDIAEIRNVAEMRFAEEMLPGAFEGYLVEEGSLTRLVRLPSEEDEFMGRVRRVRDRDYMFVDTLDSNYGKLHGDMKSAYTDWRYSRIVAMNAQREVDRKKNAQIKKGVAITVAAAAAGALAGKSSGYNPAYSGALGAAAGAGVALVLQAQAEAEIEAEHNRAALEELGKAFGVEIEPVRIQVEDEVIELSGSAETQFSQWREILAEIYRTETEPRLDDEDSGSAF